MAKGKYKRRRKNRYRKATLLKNSGMSVRTANRLSKEGINTLKDLDNYSVDSLADIDGIGKVALEEIKLYRE